MGEYSLELTDAHEFIKTLPDASVDALITDSPYGTTQLEFDKQVIRWGELWPEIYRVCKPNAVQVMFSSQPFTTQLIMSNLRRFRYALVWAKTNPTGFMNAEKMPLKCHEDVLVFGSVSTDSTYNPQKWQGKPKGLIRRSADRLERGVSLHYGKQKDNEQFNDGSRYPVSVLEFSNADRSNAMHPTQKPLELLCYLVKTYTNPGDTVLDLFAGSGTTLAACLHTGRKAIGCEISPEYHATASKRLAAVEAQQSLFTLT